MNQIYPDAGLLEWLGRMKVGGLRFHLYANNYTPIKASVLGSFTEAAWGGYATILVAAGDFTLSGVAGNIGSLLAAPIAFTNSSGASQSAYGYYVTDSGNTILLAAARFDSAPIAKLDTESWLVTPVIGDFSQFP